MRATPPFPILAALLTLTLWPTSWMTNRAPLPDEVEARSGSRATTHEFDFRNNADAALTAWALGRFERAGLQLPPLAIAFHNDKAPCNGRYGLYESGNPGQIDICAFNRNRFLMFPKKTILHELGHAWAHHALADETRQRFLEFRGLDIWRNQSRPWDEQGTEHAAEIIAWALMDQEILLTAIGNSDPAVLARAYQLLTSTRPPAWGRTPVNVVKLAAGVA